MEVETDLDRLLLRIERARKSREAVSIGYLGQRRRPLGAAGGVAASPWSWARTRPRCTTPTAAATTRPGSRSSRRDALMKDDPGAFAEAVHASLRRQVDGDQPRWRSAAPSSGTTATRSCSTARRAGAAIDRPDGSFRYPSYVEDIMGPIYFDYGFGPFRWVCASGRPEDLALTDAIAAEVLAHQAAARPGREPAAGGRQPALDPAGRVEPPGRRLAGPDPLRRPRRARRDRAGLQRRDRERAPARAGRARPRPPRRLGHRLALARDRQHPRRLALHGRHGGAELHRRRLPRRDLGQPAQRRRRRLGRGDQRRLRPAARRHRRRRAPRRVDARAGT